MQCRFLQIRSVAVLLHRPAELVFEEAAVASWAANLGRPTVKTKFLRGIATAMAVLALSVGAAASFDAPTTHPAADTGWP